MNKRLLPLLASIMFGGCAAADAPERHGPVVRDSAGIRIVENTTPLWQPGQEWRLSAEPVVDIGGGDTEEQQFFRIAGVVRLGDGRIAVADGGSQELRFYDADGRFVRAAGRRGGGPGEFQNVRWTHRMPGDSVITYDFGQKRFALFDSRGTFTRGFRLAAPSEVPVATIVDMFGDGSFLAQGAADPGGETPSELQRFDAPLYHIAADGTFLAELEMVVGFEMYYEPFRERGFRAYETFFPWFTYRRVDGNRIYLGANDTYELRRYKLDGTLTDLVRVSRTPVRVTNDHVEMEIERRLNGVGSDEEREALAKTLGQIPVPQTFPAYEDVEIDEDGNVWVHEFTKPGDTAATWAVFDSTGILLGTLTAPSRFEPHDIGADYMVGVWRDDDSVEHVQLYDLIKPGQ